MFERRLKIFLGLLIAVTIGILVRAGHLQIVAGEYWKKRAEESVRRSITIETERGRIVDFRGRVLADDAPCMDAAVDYRAIVRDSEWMKNLAQARLGAAYRKAGKEAKEELVAEELERINADLDLMWRRLAAEGGKTLDEIEEIKNNIRRKIDMRRRYIW